MTNNPFENGVRQALQIVCGQLEFQSDKPYLTDYVVNELWLAHVVIANDQCACKAQLLEDVQPLVQPCPDWENVSYRRAFYCDWYGITLEELAMQERAELERAHLTDRERRKQRVALLKAELEEELKEYGVTITLPQL